MHLNDLRKLSDEALTKHVMGEAVEAQLRELVANLTSDRNRARAQVQTLAQAALTLLDALGMYEFDRPQALCDSAVQLAREQLLEVVAVAVQQPKT
jgi:DeoR/GlpR family transcriptional regulator of sugar metabolism